LTCRLLYIRKSLRCFLEIV